MKNTKKIFWTLSVLMFVCLFSVSSCKKNHCYHCYDFFGYLRVSKNGDTILRDIVSRAWLQDSINYYTHLNYVVDSVEGFYASDPPGDGTVCDTNLVDIGIVPDSCSLII